MPQLDHDATIKLGASNPDAETLDYSGFQNTGDADEEWSRGLINILPRGALPDLIRRYRLQDAGRFPNSFTHMDEFARESNGNHHIYNIWQTDDYGFPLHLDRFKATVRLLREEAQFDADRFEMYCPQQPAGGDGDRSAVVVATENTPDEWILHQVFNGTSDFADRVGETVCGPCHEEYDEPIFECPECQAVPQSVRESLELYKEEHPGVVAVIGVNALRTKDNDSVDEETLNEAIDAYIETTGDEYLADREALREFLAEKGVGAPPDVGV